MKAIPHTICVLALALATACEEESLDDSAQDEQTTEEPTEDAGESSDADTDALYDCVDEGLLEVGPLAGPGYDPATGLVEPQDTYVGATTQILVKPDKEDLFFELTASVDPQLREAEGFVAMQVAIEPNCGFARTLSVWRSEADMYKFVATGAHAAAMARTSEIAVTGKTVSWSLSAADMPATWDLARAKLGEVEPIAGY